MQVKYKLVVYYSDYGVISFPSQRTVICEMKYYSIVYGISLLFSLLRISTFIYQTQDVERDKLVHSYVYK